MKARPILFNGDMVRAILEGRKTQTRRVIKVFVQSEYEPELFHTMKRLPRDIETSGRVIKKSSLVSFSVNKDDMPKHCPFGFVGDLLWVRESFRISTIDDYCDTAMTVRIGEVFYAANDKAGKYKPSIHMPRTASRITLEIIGVRVERLQDISEEDALAEGVSMVGEYGGAFDTSYRNYMTTEEHTFSATDSFTTLWQSINGAGSWDENPWVWVIEFTPHLMNVDAFIAQKTGAV